MHVHGRLLDTTTPQIRRGVCERISDSVARIYGCIFVCPWICDLSSASNPSPSRVEWHAIMSGGSIVPRGKRNGRETAYGRGASLAARWSSSTLTYGTVHAHAQGLIGTIPLGLRSSSSSLWGWWIDPAPPQVRSARAWLGWAEWAGAGLGGMAGWWEESESPSAEEEGLTARHHLRRGDMIILSIFLEMLWIRHDILARDCVFELVVTR